MLDSHLYRLKRGCTLGGYKIDQFFKDRKSVILGVWAAPGAPETLPKDAGRSPPTQLNGLRSPRGRADPQSDRCPILEKLNLKKNNKKNQKCSHVNVLDLWSQGVSDPTATEYV